MRADTGCDRMRGWRMMSASKPTPHLGPATGKRQKEKKRLVRTVRRSSGRGGGRGRGRARGKGRGRKGRERGGGRGRERGKGSGRKGREGWTLAASRGKEENHMKRPRTSAKYQLGSPT
jgi:hypothetical protein